MWNAEHADSVSDIQVVVVLMRSCFVILLGCDGEKDSVCCHRADTCVDIFEQSDERSGLLPHSSSSDIIKHTRNLSVSPAKSEAFVKTVIILQTLICSHFLL